MSNVVKDTRGTGRLRAAANLAFSFVLLGGCSAGSSRFASVSFGSGYGAEQRAAHAAAPASRMAYNSRQPAQSSHAMAQPARYQPQQAGSYRTASAAPVRGSSYLQASRVDLPPLQQRQPSRRTKLADGYGRYNQPPLPDGIYTGPRVSTPYDSPRDDGPPAMVFVPQGSDPRDYGRGAPPPPPPPPSDYYRRSDAPPRPPYPPRGEARAYDYKPSRSHAGEPRYNGNRRQAHGRGARDRGAEPRRSWSGRTDGEMVEVVRGDTLYTLARRYGVTVAMIARANGLSTVHVRPGTKLFIPRADPASYTHGPSRDPGGKARASAAPAKKNQQRRAVASAAKPARHAAHAAKEHKAPALGAARLANKGEPVNPLQEAAPVQAVPAVRPGPASTPEATCEAMLSNPQPRMGASFRRPVDGKTISQYGPQKDGTVNEGITISVPKGTPVKAAENGVVAYVGDELPGFGNLILIRHADEYVTAYAHADTVLVKKCDVVKRGQTVATAGTTGDVSQPQLHFEIRKNSKPVDPSPLLGS